jgi:hypothetical protein
MLTRVLRRKTVQFLSTDQSRKTLVARKRILGVPWLETHLQELQKIINRLSGRILITRMVIAMVDLRPKLRRFTGLSRRQETLRSSPFLSQA